MASKARGSASAAPTTTSPPRLWPTAARLAVPAERSSARHVEQVGDVAAQVHHPAAAGALVAAPVVGHRIDVGQPAHDPAEALGPIERTMDQDDGRSRGGGRRPLDDVKAGGVAHGQV